MICLKNITDEDLGMKPIKFENPRRRYGARGIIFNDEYKVAILYKENKNEYKLVGGGIEKDEDPVDALIRESLEETGYEISIDESLGTIEELKSYDNFIQTSYVFVAHVVKKLHSPNYTKQELDEGAKLLWLDYDIAMKKIKECEKDLKSSKYDGDLSIYHTRFIIKRDYNILKYYKINYY